MPIKVRSKVALCRCLGPQCSDRSFGDNRVRELAYGGMTPRCILRRDEDRTIVQPRPQEAPYPAMIATAGVQRAASSRQKTFSFGGTDICQRQHPNWTI